MSKFDMVVELMVKNGVTTKFSENLYENLVNNKPIIELDFTKHDKVFKDKYKVLEEEYGKKCKDYKSVSALLSTYQQENESLKKRIIELENFSCQAEQETESLVEKLKQRIAELESKETEKPTKYITVIVAKKIDGQTYVTLDDFMSVVNDLQAEIGT